MVQHKFKVLQRGNFYFPYLDKDKKFIVWDTFELEIKRKEFAILKVVKKHKSLFFGEYAEPIWNAIKKLVKNKKQYKNCWFVPIRLADYGKDKIYVIVDVLKKA